MISRRRFLRTTLLGGALLGGAAIVGRHLSGYSLDPAIASQLRALSPKEYLIFDAVARRLLAPDGADAPDVDSLRVALFVDSYLARLDEGLRSDVRALLQLVEHGGFLFRLQGSRFTHLGEADQDAVLADWQSSRLAVRRRGFQALRTLAFLGYYRDDRTWPLLAYTGPSVRR
ncbi:MAG TPA: gluconate 2-dehydrogenase subunit 3 family protein [Polyangia bacterium]|nr:gluconate 2-dehydrogenase subunit 3 family protein [Polyangia bacterium]